MNPDEGMSLKDRNTRFALLKAMADFINDELAAERGDHTTDLVRKYTAEGTTSFNVMLPDGGGTVAKLTLSIPKATTTVVDDAAFLAWCQVNQPGALTEVVVPAEPAYTVPAIAEHTIYGVDPKQQTIILEDAKPVDGAGPVVDPETGLVIDGVAYAPAASPRSFAVRYEKDGRERLGLAYRAGRLSHLVGGSSLPALDAPPVAYPMGPGPVAYDDDPVPLTLVEADPDKSAHVEGCYAGSAGTGPGGLEFVPGDLDCICPPPACTHCEGNGSFWVTDPFTNGDYKKTCPECSGSGVAA